MIAEDDFASSNAGANPAEEDRRRFRLAQTNRALFLAFLAIKEAHFLLKHSCSKKSYPRKVLLTFVEKKESDSGGKPTLSKQAK